MKRLFCIVDPSVRDFIGHHLEYDASTARAAKALGYEAVCLGHAEADLAVAEQLPLRRTFRHDIWWTPEGAPRAEGLWAANTAFEEDLRAAGRTLPLQRDSVIFGHMITAGQILGWARYIESLPRASRPLFVLLLRYQPELYAGAAADEGFARIRKLVKSGADIRLTSDSEPLAIELSRVAGLPLKVLPLPHTGHAPPPGRPPEGPRPLRAVSLGNAREEKGLLEIIEAAELIQVRGHGAKFEFVLQANDPEAGIAPAIRRFEADAPPNVKLLTSALSSAEYAELLHSADIVLVPYRREIYQARTSGVFVEALAAGKPIICTQDTWLSQQLDLGGAGLAIPDRSAAALARALVEIGDDYPRFLADALAKRGAYLAIHNPHSLVRGVVEGGRAAGQPVRPRAAMFYPWGDGHRRVSGASLRVNLLAEFLTQRGNEVRLLQDSAEENQVQRGIRFETYPMLALAPTRSWFRRAAEFLARFAAKPGEEIYALLHIYARFDPELQRRIDEMVRWADVVFLEYSFWAAPVAAACRRYNRTLILTAHDVVSSQVQGRWLRVLTRWLERFSLGKADHLAVLAPGDFPTFQRWGLPVVLTPTAVDPDRVRQPEGRSTRALLNRLIGLPDEDATPIFLFVGTDFAPNISAANHIRAIAKAFAEQFPGEPIRLVVAGTCAAAGQEGLFMALGLVSEVVLRLLYANCAAVLAPLTEGTGASTKAFEALAAGAPIVATSLGLRGVEVDNREGCIVEERLETWPILLKSLIQDPEGLLALRRSAEQTGQRFTPATRFAPYLALAPALANDVAPAGLTTVARELELATARAAADQGLTRLALDITDALLQLHPQDAETAALQATVLAAGTASARVRAMGLLDRAIDDGGDAIDILRAQVLLLERDRRVDEAKAALALGARLAVNRACAPGRELKLRMEMWRAFHGGEKAWAHAVAREALATWGDDTHFDYSYLFALIESDQPDADLGRALASAEQAVAKGADPFWANCLIADLRRRTGKPLSQVAFAYKLALESPVEGDSRNIAFDGVCWAAWRHFENGEIEFAYDLIDVACKARPDSASAHYLRAECLHQRGQPVELVIGEFERARVCGYDPLWCDLHIARLLQQLPPELERDINVRAAVDRVMERRPSTAILNRVREAAWKAFTEGAFDTAVSLADAGIASWPEDGTLHYLLAECLQILHRDLERCVAAYDKALAHGHEAYWVYFNRAQAQRKLGRHALARLDLQQAIDSTRDPARRSAALTSLEQLRQAELAGST